VVLAGPMRCLLDGSDRLVDTPPAQGHAILMTCRSIGSSPSSNSLFHHRSGIILFQELLSRVQLGQDLTCDEMQQVMGQMLAGELSQPEMGQLLLALRDKGESVSELVGATRAMRTAMTPIRTTRQGLLDTCGTGGDGLKTFNISTAAAIVAAACGVPVAKHGNRAITSASGSADVLSQLGVRVDAPREIVERCLDELGICFCYAPLLHPAMRQVAEVRRSLGVTTLFNYLGPLCNPASASFQVLGVGKPELQQKLAASLAQLGATRALIARGLDGLDEISLSANTSVIVIESGTVEEQLWDADRFGLPAIDMRELAAPDPSASAEVIRRVLQGQPGACRNVVIANAAAGVWLTKPETNLRAAVAQCQQAIDSGKAAGLLQELANMTSRS
jgi:anthranilate phosphoribosyltransferase